jgi:uncharacterized protein with PIN domain
MKTIEEKAAAIKTATCWNCAAAILEADPDQLILYISRPGVGTQQQRVNLCTKCGEIFGKE